MKIGIVAGICVERDAISAAVAERAEFLSGLDPVTDVVIVAQHFDRETSVDQLTIVDAWGLLCSERVAACDLLIFHWGISYDLFDALPLIALRQKVVVHFHNVTPPHILDESDRNRHAVGLLQLQIPVDLGIPTWTESDFNAQTLYDLGYPASLVSMVPFPVEPPRQLVNRALGDGTISLITVGRLVPAKGLEVLIRAMPMVIDQVGPELTLTLIGSMMLSDRGFVAQLEALIDELALTEFVVWKRDIGDDALWDAYECAHILVSPSLHEGLCVPVFEAYHAGCRVVSTDAGNLPNVVQPPDLVVSAGDPDELARGIVATIRRIRSKEEASSANVDELLYKYSAAGTRTKLLAEIASVTGYELC